MNNETRNDLENMIRDILVFCSGNMDASEIPDPSNAIRVSKLLGVDPREMVDALTTKTIFAQGDSVVSHYFS